MRKTLHKAAKPPRSLLGDFTADRRVLVLIAMAVVVGVASTVSAWILLKLIALITSLVWTGHMGVAGASPAHVKALWWIVAAPALGGLAIGLIARFGSENPWPRYPRSDRGNPDRRQPHAAEGRLAQAAVVRNIDWNRRSIWCRRPDHHDRRRHRLIVRAVLSSRRGGTQDAARRRCGFRHDRDFQHAARRGAAGGGTAFVRME